MGAYNDTSSRYEGNCWWWLRSPGPDTSTAAYADFNGFVGLNGGTVYGYSGAVAPVLHLNLASDLWFQTDDGTSGEGGGTGSTPGETNPGSGTNSGSGGTGGTTPGGGDGSGTGSGGTGGTNQKPAPSKPAKGTILKSGKKSYKVTKSGSTVAFQKTSDKSQSISIPATVKIGGITYKVTSIEADAFKNNKKLTKVTIGKNVTTIGKNAFRGCSSLSKVTVGKNVTTIGDGAFSGCKKLTKIALEAKVKKIGKEAFKSCSKLGTITVKSKKVTSVGKNAFKGIKSNAKIRVPASKYQKYQKLFKGKGQGKKVKIVKI